jgi:hypothetical protein
MSQRANPDGWRVVWIAFVVAVFGWGIGFYGPAVYLPALHQARGWSISTISAAITAHYLVSAALITAFPKPIAASAWAASRWAVRCLQASGRLSGRTRSRRGNSCRRCC